MEQQKHIINKVFLEVGTNSNELAHKFKDNLAVFFKYQVFPKIENYFEKYYPEASDITMRFNKVEIDINKVDIDHFPEIANRIVEQFKKKMDSIIRRAGIHPQDNNEWTLITKSKSKLDAFLYFLKTGYKPWWSPNLQSILTLQNIKIIKSENGFYSEIVKALAFKTVRERLVNQFKNEVLWIILRTSDSEKTLTKQKVFKILDKNKVLRYHFWNAIIEHYTLQRISTIKDTLNHLKTVKKSIDAEDFSTLKTFIASIIEKPIEKVETFQFRAKETTNNPTEILVTEAEDGFFVDNAGLVIMHPFLKHLFKNAKLIDSNGKIKPSKIETAIHLLHYLSTKKQQQLESELVLEKFLCGYPISKPMSRFIKLPKVLKQMADEVLQSAISHWIAVKNTSPDGLRTGFLQREGKLVIENDTGRLIIERKGQDVLLDKIPWNINLIKLPWRDKIIYVEW